MLLGWYLVLRGKIGTRFSLLPRSVAGHNTTGPEMNVYGHQSIEEIHRHRAAHGTIASEMVTAMSGE